MSGMVQLIWSSNVPCPAWCDSSGLQTSDAGHGAINLDFERSICNIVAYIIKIELSAVERPAIPGRNFNISKSGGTRRPPLKSGVRRIRGGIIALAFTVKPIRFG